MQGTLLSKLSVFVTVATRRHFGKAAAELGLSNSSLSQTIKSLEERLGVRLLNRTTRSVNLTPAGERLLSELEPVMTAVSQAIDGVNDFRDNPTGTLRLSITRAAAVQLIAPLLPEFLAEHPGITLEIIADDRDIDIVTGRIDAGIRTGEWIEKDMVAVRVFDEFRMVAVASPSYLGRHPAPSNPAQLTEHNCLRRRWPKGGAIQSWEFECGDRRCQVAINGSFIADDLALLIRAAVDGIGIAYLPEMAVATAIAAGTLNIVLGDWAPRISGLFLYYTDRHLLPAPLRAFIAFMRRHRHSTVLEAADGVQPTQINAFHAAHRDKSAASNSAEIAFGPEPWDRSPTAQDRPPSKNSRFFERAKA
jgi:DNA-binding transcriptional LysR family regulator